MDIRIFAFGDLVGAPGKQMVAKRLRAFCQQENIEYVIGNAENAADRGAGITPKDCEALWAAGVGVLTAGDHVWDRHEIVPVIDRTERLLRPFNYDSKMPGRGWTVVESPNGFKIGVLHVQGRVFMSKIQANCPFQAADEAIRRIHEQTKVVVVDVHAEATSEKIALGWHLDGRASFVFGSHTHVQTADSRVLPQGTAYITDLGMSGPYESVLGRRVDRVLHKFITQMPAPFDVATGDVRICGAIATVNVETGRAVEIERITILEDGTVKKGKD